MPFTCEAARFEDGLALANAYISAFYGDPFHDTLIRDVPFDRQVAGVIKRFPRNFVKPTSHYRKVVDTDTSAVVSYARWGLENTDENTMFPQDRSTHRTDLALSILLAYGCLNCKILAVVVDSGLIDVPEFQHTTEAPYSDPEGINDRPVGEVKLCTQVSGCSEQSPPPRAGEQVRCK
ncbi:hypothetical protein TOPH_02006 [Tolypocladium ophioglossoides CBS 100239]|uniref:Uncharacterized protein n=1 Tax=Tolypocladium ophioglossoides (strain CBS 100239) TaxID=1163406 RepID=A0A0L0NGP3_TOLOC|nr:hypothetical protein TOPH_02006 [Tolypocladium ophioglossoides CBS 100239]